MPDLMQHSVSPGTAPAVVGIGPATTRPDDESLPIELAQPVGIAVVAGGDPANVGAPGPPAGMPQAASRTQISGDRPAGMPTHISGRPPPPEIAVVTAPDIEPASLVWWGVLLVALACLAVGIVVGYALA
jgi:hypothetical protein